MFCKLAKKINELLQNKTKIPFRSLMQLGREILKTVIS